MKSLIVIPKYYRGINESYLMPIGMAYINAALRNAGLDVDCINLNQVDPSSVYETLADIIVEKDIDCVLCGGLSPMWKILKKVFRTCKKAKPSVITIGGGGCFTSEPIIASEMCGVDYAVIGEGEVTDVELLLALRDNKDVKGIKGIVYKTPDGYVQTAPREQILDMDSIPFPCYEGFGMEKYLDDMKLDDNYYAYFSDNPRIMPMVLGRSCPFQCKFCFHPTGNRYVARSLDSFFEELDQWMAMYRPSGIIIVDELFSSSVERVYEFCRRIREYDIKWIVQLRVDIVTEDILYTMRDAGCISISYGLESYNPEVLINMRKHISTEDIDNALKLTYDAGVDMQGNFIFGDELETEESIYESLRFYFDHPEYQLNLGMISTYPGSGYYKELMKGKSDHDKREFIEKQKWLANLTRMPDEVYEKYREVSQLLRQFYHPIPAKEQRIYLDEEGKLTVEFKCIHCGKHNVHHGVSKWKSKWFSVKVGCRFCNHRNVVYIDRWNNMEAAQIEPLCRAVAGAENIREFKHAVDDLYRKHTEIRNLRKYQYPLHENLYGKKVIIYGAGVVGRDYYRQLCQYQPIDVVALADTYSEYIDGECVEVIAPEDVIQKEFDVLIVAVLDISVAGRIKDSLAAMGIPRNKIEWSMPQQAWRD